MGQFIDTQQGLLTEAKQKRLEREQRQKDKKRQEEQEKQLFYLLDEELTTADNKNKKYIELSKNYNRLRILETITNNKNDIYILLKKYNKILTLAFNSFKEEIKEQEAEQKKELIKRLEEELKNHFKIASNKLTFQYLTQEETKNAIINNISNTQEEAEMLNILYYKALSNVYKGYKYNLQQINQTIEEEEEEEEEETHKRSNMFYITLFSCILFVVLAIIHFVAITKIIPGFFALTFLWYKFKK